MKKILLCENKFLLFLWLMKKGYGKIGYKVKNGKFFMMMSEDSYKCIVFFIWKWLE